MTNISDFVNVDINIVAPQAVEAAYNGMLLVIDSVTGTKSISDVVEIKGMSELSDYGIVSSSDAYKAIDIAFSANPRPTSVFLADRKTVDDELEDIEDTLDRALANGKWYGFALVDTNVDTEASAAATWAVANRKMFSYCWVSGTTPSWLANNSMSWGIYAGNHEAVPSGAVDYNKFANIAWMAKCFGYVQGSETWAFKTLDKRILPSTLTSTEAQTIRSAGGNTYQNVSGINVTGDGIMGDGEWIDTIRFRDWLITKIQTEVFNVFVQNRKLPFIDSGITAIYNVLNAVLKTGQNYGGIALDTFDENGELNRGYTITVPRAKDVPQADKALRKLIGIKFTAVLAGAIHTVGIAGNLVYNKEG